MELFLAITLGTLFGFALNRAGATNPENIINMLRLTDLRLMKAILFAIGLSSILLFVGLQLGLVPPAHLSVKSAYIGVAVGGALLGIGFAISGYCPGTSLSAAATGRRDALFFVIGGFLGAFAYTLAYGWLNEHTALFQNVTGGAMTLAQTGNEKYPALLQDINGTIIGLPLGILFIAIAKILPASIRHKE